MAIILSAHKDKVFCSNKFELESGKFTGLLDNKIGELAMWTAILSNPALQELLKNGIIKVYSNEYEEFGGLSNPPKIGKKDKVLVIDVAAMKEYKGLDFSLENIHGFERKEINALRNNLKWEDFKLQTKYWSGKECEEDESWSFKKLNKRVISFIIPIECGEEGQWHTNKCELSLERFNKAIHGLTRTICYLL